MTWIPWCIESPGPALKQGYWNVSSRRLDQILGEVKHSAGGSLAAAFGELDKPSRQASWTFTITQDGTVYQHYPLEAVTWHCGVKGSHTIPGNVSLVGEEHVGGGPGSESEPLTPLQLASSVRLSQDIRALCPLVAANPPATRVNLWEHNWLSSTACPSGRIPWQEIIAQLAQGGEPVELPDGLYRIAGGPEVYLKLGLALIHIPSQEALAALATDIQVVNRSELRGAVIYPDMREEPSNTTSA